MKKTDYLSEFKEIDILLIKNMFSLKKPNMGTKNTPSPLQFRICKYLKKNEDKLVSQSDLEKSLQVSRSAISGVLLTMEKRGTIERVTSDKDARVKYVKLTESSLQGFKELQKNLDKLNEKIVANISEEDLCTFSKVLQAMKENLKIANDKTK